MISHLSIGDMGQGQQLLLGHVEHLLLEPQPQGSHPGLLLPQGLLDGL